MIVTLLAAAALSSAEIPTTGPTTGPPSAASDEIVVTGTRASTLDLRKLLKGQKRFAEARAQFAPKSALVFQLSSQVGRTMATTLRLERGNETLKLPVGIDGTFALPSGITKDWELVHNRPAGQIRVRPLILSPGTSVGNRRLGDLRLQCRVGWDMEDASIFVRSAFGAIGGCDSSRAWIYFHADRPIAQASASDGDRIENVRIGRNRAEYRPPLYNRRLSNEARVRLTFAD